MAVDGSDSSTLFAFDESMGAEDGATDVGSPDVEPAQDWTRHVPSLVDGDKIWGLNLLL